MYKKGQIMTIRRRIVSVSQRPFKIIRKNMVCQIKEVPKEEQNYTNPCALCEGEYIRCGAECKLEGHLYYKEIKK